MQRSTRQLATTLDVLAAASDHPTAEQILLRVRERLPRVSLGTVYRNLEKLRMQGQLRVVNVGPGVARYDALLGEHDHFVCDTCDAVIDLAPLPGQMDVSALRSQGYVVRLRSVVVHGVCRSCAAGERHQSPARQPVASDAVAAARQLP